MAKDKTLLLRVEAERLTPTATELSLPGGQIIGFFDDDLAAATVHTITITKTSADRPAAVVLVPAGWRHVKRGQSCHGDLVFVGGEWVNAGINWNCGESIIIRRTREGGK